MNPGFLAIVSHFLIFGPGPVPGLSIRALGSSLPLVLIKRLAHVRAVGG